MKILRLPPFLIFLLFFVAPLFLVGPIRMIINLIFSEPDFSNLIILVLLYFFFCYSWELAIGLSFSRLLPPAQSFRRPVYLILFSLRIFLLLYTVISAATAENLDALYAASLLPGVLLWYSLSLYVRYENAKIVRAVELDRSVKLHDVIIYFILHNMLAFGLWVIQGSITATLQHRRVQSAGKVVS